MRLVLHPAEDAVHEDWLRQTSGAYEWWYFDAVSDDTVWAFTAIWFLGNPFSPYYRLSSLGKNADPYAHNALFFALYKEGKLYAYHFTRFPKSDICAASSSPATLQFGPNYLNFDGTNYTLRLEDENANRRILQTNLVFSAVPLVPEVDQSDRSGDSHSWLPAAPACRVSGQISLREHRNSGAEHIPFRGHGYHDHNWGTLPFDKTIRDWYWMRVSLGEGQAVILYHVRHRAGRASISHLLRFDNGRLIYHDASAQVQMRCLRLSGFATLYATQFSVRSGAIRAEFQLGARLDSAPFYVRTLCRASYIAGGVTEMGTGIGEYFKPQMLAWPLVASATKSRIKYER